MPYRLFPVGCLTTAAGGGTVDINIDIITARGQTYGRISWNGNLVWGPNYQYHRAFGLDGDFNVTVRSI